MRSFLGFIAFAVVFSSTVFSHETGKKIYVSPNQVEITENGVLGYLEGSEKPVAGKTLSFDELGMYIKEWKGPCWLHDLWCHRCGGCGILFCPMNCSCFD